MPISGLISESTAAMQAVLLALCKDTHGIPTAILINTLALGSFTCTGMYSGSLVKDKKISVCSNLSHGVPT